MKLNKWCMRIVCGILLYIISLLMSFWNCLNFPDDVVESILIISFIVGASVTAFATLYKNRTLVEAIKNLIIIIAIWFVAFVLNGYLGTVVWLGEILKLEIPYENNAAGLLVVIFIWFNCCLSVIAMIIRAIVKWLINRKNNI